ncbi:MAG TPA: VWA domain-containing protein, partial [Bryobacteraceae bacterium]|nr:VWA domain-containing protein [Bryobacteraceae bacterium]
MSRFALLVLLGTAYALAADEEFVFKSDVSLIRVDAQVVDRSNRAITGLQASDFTLHEQGKLQEIRNFANEDMPLDVLFLLDVSGSMRPQIERMASASREALRALGNDDRVGIMVFDRQARIRTPFRRAGDGIQRELELVIDQESFDGGTDINRGIDEAARDIGRNGRREARRAIVILTDDQTEFGREEDAMVRALARVDAVMSALIAPDMMMSSRGPFGGGSGPSIGGGGWPNDPLGGIIFGRRGPMGGSRYPRGGGSRYPGGGSPFPGGGSVGGRTRSAGTSAIAERSGGDSLPADNADALEDTLQRLRQRYALHFYQPADARAGQERSIEVDLAAAARRRYPDAQVRYRRVYVTQGDAGSAPSVVSKGEQTPVQESSASSGVTSQTPSAEPERKGGWRRATEEPKREDAPAALEQRRSDTQVADQAPTPRRSRPAADEPVRRMPSADDRGPSPDGAGQSPGGWRRVKP